MFIRNWLLVIASLGLIAGSAQAETPACPSAKEMQTVSVSSVFQVPAIPMDPGETAKDTEPALPAPIRELRQAIGVKVNHLDILLQKEKCSPLHKKIVLFLDGRAMTDLKPYPHSDPANNILYFQLRRTEASREIWTYLLGKPKLKPRAVQVSVGLEDEYAVPAAGEADPAILLDVIPTRWLLYWSVVVLILFFGCIALARRSDMLRDSGTKPPDGQRKAYSLARVQLATWTFLVLGSYLFIGLITGDYTTSITDSVLALMGISAGTAVGSSIADMGPPRAPAAPAAPAAIVVPAGEAGPPPAPVQAGPAQQAATATSGRWWIDILTGGDGINFHRFQMAAWTIVLGIIFVQQVYRDLAMPDFAPSLLALIGISAGTYLGLKVTSE
jgi:hypothetical protein